MSLSRCAFQPEYIALYLNSNSEHLAIGIDMELTSDHRIRLIQSLFICFLLCSFAWGHHAYADTFENKPSPFRIYLDADQTNSVSSGKSIELGIRAALSESNGLLAGHEVELVIKDHHGSTPRSRHHLEQFLADPHALAVFGGLHSPPLIAARDYINNNQVLTFVPWAAATPITRSKTSENWIFRLSIDDSKAGKVIINDTIQHSGFKQPYLLLEDTGWGKANKNTMTKALSDLGYQANGIHFFQWGIGQHEARTILENAVSNGADSFVLVANAPEGITFAKAMLSLDKPRQRSIRSHWGITGGTFFQSLGASAVNQLDLRFIQTRFSLLQEPLSSEGEKAMAAASTVSNSTLSPTDIKAPSGFIHAYDLTRILIAASEQSPIPDDPKQARQIIKTNLENLRKKIPGLVKYYKQPFSSDVETNFDAHEALGLDDFVMAHFDQHGNIRLTEQSPSNMGEANHGN